MTCRGVRLIFFSLAFFCYGLLVYGGSGTKDREIKVNLQINSELPICSVKIGSNVYRLLLSTWFSEFWLFSKSACDAQERKAKELEDLGKDRKEDPVTYANSDMCKNVQKYDDTNLKTKKGESFEVPYLQGTLKGYVITESLEINGRDLQQQSIGILTDWPPKLATKNKVGRFDGFFGLMFMPKGNEDNGSPFFKYLVDNNKIARKQFGIYFNSARGSGELILGGINNKYIVGGETSLKEVPVESGGKGWLININSIKVGSTEVGLLKNIKAYVDTSTSGFFGKREIISQINNALKAKETDISYDDTETGEIIKETLFKFADCKADNIEMTINNKLYTLDSSTYVVNIYGDCTSAFQIKELEDYDLILGSLFLNKYYSVFDVEKKKVHFAEANSKGLMRTAANNLKTFVTRQQKGNKETS